MPDYTEVYEQQLQRQQELFDNAYDYADTDRARSLVMAFAPITKDKPTRLRLIGEIVGREIVTTKQLRVGEVEALKLMCADTLFVATMKEAI